MSTPHDYPGTRLHSMRIPDAVWARAIERSRHEGSSVSAEVNEFLRTYTAAPKRSWRRPVRPPK